MAIRYTSRLEAVDWNAMRAVLLADDFDNGRTPDQYRRSFEASAVCVLAYDGAQLVGTLRVLSDGVCNAYMVDVWTYSPYRRQGIAREMVRLALDQLWGQHVYLFTDDAPEFYEKLGFRRRGVGLELVQGRWLVDHPEG